MPLARNTGFFVGNGAADGPKFGWLLLSVLPLHEFWLSLDSPSELPQDGVQHEDRGPFHQDCSALRPLSIRARASRATFGRSRLVIEAKTVWQLEAGGANKNKETVTLNDKINESKVPCQCRRQQARGC